MNPPRAPLRFAFALLPALVLSACPDDGAPSGSPCSGANECSSGLCLTRTPGVRVCARRCSQDTDCSSGDVCGRFDYRGRDLDSGLPEGSDLDVVRVCRPPLQGPCSLGCGEDLCFGEGISSGVCSLRCERDLDCAGRACVRSGCRSVCSPPCDSLAECPRGYSCDLAFTDQGGHGQCIPIGEPSDAGVCALDAR